MKIFLLFFAALALLTGCHGRLLPAPLTVGADSSEIVGPLALRATLFADSATVDRNDSVRRAELAYYLERHNVQDEGYEMVAAYMERPDTLLSLLATEAAQLTGIGHWRDVASGGTVIRSDSTGRVIIGTRVMTTDGCPVADSLETCVRLDSAGIYAGDLSVSEKACGHGYYVSDKGDYYEGLWADDCRHGLGLSVSTLHGVRLGEWRQDRYMGERMRYTSERIYGIDISRYQHGTGRKKYPILWNQLRVTYLGNNQKHALGNVDYPVRFVFIKSTESTNIRNPFYKADYLQARRQGIPIGAYHFFSWKTSGAAQARYFLANTLFRRGDLPPVLDLEPSQKQIEAMGGTEAMFSQVRTFLKHVELFTHVRPILYVSQQFVNRYLTTAPDLKRNYQVWIARYGEYKPDVKLALWQLSPNGRVRGIRGEVDINVFNGFHTQFEHFISEETIK